MISGLKGRSRQRAERFIEEIREARRALGETVAVEDRVWIQPRPGGQGLKVTFERLEGSLVSRRTTVREGTNGWNARVIATALVRAARFERDRLDATIMVAKVVPLAHQGARAPERYLHAHADGVSFEMRCLSEQEARILLEAAGRIEESRKRAA